MKVCCLGIVSTPNYIGIAIIFGDKEVTNIQRTFEKPPGDCLQPNDKATYYCEEGIIFITEALAFSKISSDDVDVIAYTKSAYDVCGLIARTLTTLWMKPVVEVNSPIARIEMGQFLINIRNPIVLYVSAGETQVITFDNGRYRIFGGTLDIAAGKCLDSFARMLKISKVPSYGHNIEQLAKNGKKFIELPYCVKGPHVSFTDILAHIEQLIAPSEGAHGQSQDPVSNIGATAKESILNEYSREDLCFSLQETIFAMLVEITERVMGHCHCAEVFIIGGVGRNKRLQEMMATMCKERKGYFYDTDERYCCENSSMIASMGSLMFKCGFTTSIAESALNKVVSIDEVDALWRFD